MNRVLLPKLHAHQQVIADCPARFIVVAAGRRFGKSWLAQMLALDAAINHGKAVWWLSPTHGNSWTHYLMVQRMIGDLASYKSAKQYYMEFAYKGQRGSLTFKSGDREDNLRGSGLDFVVLDEAAYMSSSLWNDVVRPTLIDKEGHALFLSTPKGYGNFFHQLYLRGLDTEKYPDWRSFHFSSADNLSIPGMVEEVKRAKKDMTTLKFRQEILAEFVQDAGGVFFDVEKAAIEPVLTAPEEGKTYVAGVDIGRHHDYTVFTVLEILSHNTAKQVAMYRISQAAFNAQIRWIEEKIARWHPLKTYIENNSIAMPIVEELENRGLSVKAVKVTRHNKGPLIEKLSTSLQKGRLTLLDARSTEGSIQLGEMVSYEMKRSQTGMARYGAVSGAHDDTIMALAFAHSHLRSRSGTLHFSENPFFQ